MDVRAGFDVTHPVGPNYLGGLLGGDARIAIHMAHRLGAIAVLLVAGALVWRMLRSPGWYRLGVIVGALLAIQLALGIANVWLSLPLWVATAHNATGALLLLGVVTVNYRSFRSEVGP